MAAAKRGMAGKAWRKWQWQPASASDGVVATASGMAKAARAWRQRKKKISAANGENNGSVKQRKWRHQRWHQVFPFLFLFEAAKKHGVSPAWAASGSNKAAAKNRGSISIAKRHRKIIARCAVSS
jgi:hypothetical protein